MSLEAALAAHGELLAANTAALLASNEGRGEALAAAKAITEKAAPAKKAAAAAAPAETPAEPTPPAAAAAAEPAAPAESAAKPSVDLSADPVAKSISDYLSFTSDTDQTPTSKEERGARSAEVKRIMGTVGAEKHSQIPADKHAIFIKTMAKKLSDGNLIKVEEAAAEEPDALLG